MRHRPLHVSSLLSVLLFACGSTPPASPPPPVAAPAVVHVSPGTASAPPESPPDPDAPIHIERAAEAAPWVERDSKQIELWEASPRVNDVVHPINPILGDLRAKAIEPGAIVLQSRVGQLVITKDGVRGVVPKGVRFVGVVTSGEVFAENEGHAPFRAASVDDLIAGKQTPVVGIDRVFDAAGMFVVAARGGVLVQSKDGGKTFVDVPMKGSVEHAFVRADGVILAAAAGRKPAETWSTIDAKGKVVPVRRALEAPLRWGGFILHALKRDDFGQVQEASVLTKDGRTFATLSLPEQIQGAEFVSFDPWFLGAEMNSGLPWEGDVLAAAPEKPGRAKFGVLGPSGMKELDVPAEDPSEQSGISLVGPLRQPARPVCEGLRCIHELRGIVPRNPASSLVGRFFDDALCKRLFNKPCEKGPLLRGPTIGIFHWSTRAFLVRPTPEGCEPLSLESLRGLVILDCRKDRFVSDASGVFFREGSVDTPTKGYWGYTMAEDGTLLAQRVESGSIIAAALRLPVAPGAAGAWRNVVRSGGVTYTVLPKGAVLVATSNDAGNELTLTLDAPEGSKELVAKVPVTRPVYAIKVESGYPELHFFDGQRPGAARISRRGALIDVPR
ncbi:hypothetical protein [Polyangium sp. y55x31]|uniref:hypothetical protein n=1 Tax=Polyangium sp. y55x31 TaxID=3042688 RepID=UPI00248211F7|nr:hypothetical protein [Polyangium sp. y55x31]MDI1481650.1 hypothetical protein [Polyangium sp. y55x31]